MDCLKCGFSNPDTARFCAGCGASLASLECPHCLSENAPGSRFCNSCGNSLAVSGQSQEPPGPTAEQPRAERRLLTVMFCDLVDSTSIVADLDPEETRAIIRDFQSHCRGVIEQFGGRITEYLGDGIVAQFTRHETNAERAISSALELIRKLKDSGMNAGDKAKTVQVRCGIATGLAVVGDMLGDARIRSESAIGLPLNLAARIQNLADPNEIIIAGDTYRLTRGLFEFEDLGLHTLKGIKNPQQVWRVLKERHVSSRFVAHTADITPMVDREEVMDVLLDTWESSMQGQAAAVVFTGEAGIGKSRILQELGKKIANDNFYYLDYQCAPYHVNTSLYPLISRLENAAQFEHGDSSKQRLAKLESLIHSTASDFENVMPAFASLLGLQAEEKWPTPNLDPEEKKQWIFNALINNMFSLAKIKPLLIKIEDVHWIDPTTMELMSRMVRALPGHPILLLITTRPGFEPDFMDESHVSLLEIDRLPQQYTAQLVRGVKGSDTLPEDVLEEVINRTEGIPLFIEELSKSLLEGMVSAGSSENSSQLAKKDIPTSLHDSLLSRLDRLPGKSRLIAQLAAVIGRQFSFDLLEQVADYKDKNLYQDLTPLLESQLVYQDKAPPSAVFSFKHALVRDVAYENLLQSDRIDIHKRIARAIEDNYPEIIKNTPELVARHYTEGKEYERAVQYWLEAGKKASQNSANVEARSHLETGLSLVKSLDDSTRADYYELRILLLLGLVVLSAEGAGAQTTRKIYKRALELSQAQSDTKLKFTTLWNCWRISVNDGFPKAIKWANELLELAKITNDEEQLLQAHHCQWGTLYNLGQQKLCCHHIEQGIKLYDPIKHFNHASIYGGHDPLVCAFGQLALSLWLRGHLCEAEVKINQAQNYALELDHLGTNLHQIDISLMYYRFLENTNLVKKQLKYLEALTNKQRLVDYSAKAKIFLGWAQAIESNPEDGLKLLLEGQRQHFSTGTWEDKPVYLEMSAQIREKLTDYSGALEDIELALLHSEKSGLSYWDAELHRRKGLLLLATDKANIQQAEKFLLRAKSISKKQSAKLLELRAVNDLVKLYTSQSSPEEARRIADTVQFWINKRAKLRIMFPLIDNILKPQHYTSDT